MNRIMCQKPAVEFEKFTVLQGNVRSRLSWSFAPSVMAIVLSIVMVFGLSPSANAQTKPFTADQATFLAEMTTFIMDADRKEGRKFMEEEFAPVWNGSFYNERQRVQIMNISNFMLKKRFSAFPDFRDLMSVVTAFPNSGRTSEEMDAWLRGLEQMVESGRKQNVVTFLGMCAGLFRESTIFKSASTEWKSRTNKFTFQFDSIPLIIFPRSDLVCLAKEIVR
ncbi:MAG: hypothetical protein IPI91_18675 [Flavobacteriales bacterium]|nr:hypothetical protein [Flavobacteriales bacterium]